MTFPFLYQRLGYVALNVTDLGKSTVFYRDQVGLDVSQELGQEGVTLRCSPRATNLVLYQSAQPGLRRVGFQLRSTADLQAARAHYMERGYSVSPVAQAERDFLQIGEAFRLLEPVSGVCFEFYADMIEPAKPFQQRLAKIQRLGHVVIKTDQFEQVCEILAKDFNLVSSDFVEDKAVWMRCYPNPFHHTFAVLKSDKPGLHHINFMVKEIDDIGKARNRLMSNDTEIVFGPGRHMPSGSIFLYYLDPDAMTVEYSFGMEEFPPQGAREPRMLKNAADTMDLWGGFPSQNFCAKGSIIKADSE